jgi:hypothetical protein
MLQLVSSASRAVSLEAIIKKSITSRSVQWSLAASGFVLRAGLTESHLLSVTGDPIRQTVQDLHPSYRTSVDLTETTELIGSLLEGLRCSIKAQKTYFV